MSVRQIDRAEWRPFFDAVTKMLEGKRAEIEVASLKLGDQIEADWLTLLGITYDPNDDVLEVALDGLDHLIYRPREVYIDPAVGGMTSIEVVRDDDVKEIILLREPLMLPAAA